MKLVLIHQNIESDLLLINSFNSECIICKISDYIFLEQSLNYDTNYKNIIKQILNSVDDLSCITHLTFVYKFYGDYNIPFFYTSNNSEYPFFNKNIIELINILKIQNTNIIIDILTCGLNTNEFTDTVSKLELDLNLNIRYSINCNNNNWILESNNYDIKNEYFTDSILKWSGKLDINYSTENILVPCIISDIISDISMFNLTKNSVNLSWSEPSDKSSELLYYHVYKSTDTSNWDIVSSLLPTTTTLLINGLTPNTTYYFKILTENSIGKSNPYNILSITTLNFTGPFINKVLQKNIHTKGSETCLGTTSDSSGNAYVIYSIDANNTNMDIILQKFDIYGNIIWSKQSQIKCNIKETIQLANINIITDNQNNILFTYCANNENNNGDFDIIIFKLDLEGDILWSCNYHDNTTCDLFITEISPYITIDNLNNIYVINEKYLDCTTCIKLTKISSNGNIVWSNIIEKHNSIQRFYPIIKFSVSGYLYLSYLQSYTEIVIKKLDLDGQIVWVKNNIFNRVFKYNIDVDVYDNIYCSFSALDNFIESTNQQQTQIIILKMDSNSNIIWEKQIEKFNTNNTCINSQIKYDSFFNEILLVYNNLSESKINGLYNIMFIRINPTDGNIINIEKNTMLNRYCKDYLPIISSNNNGTIHVSYESDSLINNSSNIVLVKYNLISSSPTNIQVKNGILSWTPPYNFEDTHSYGYKIRLFDEIIATTTDTFLNLTNLGLTLGEKNMSVTTYNIHGESCDKSAQINFSYNTPFIAQNFICDTISDNQVDLKWEESLNNSNFDISGYILSYYDILSPSTVTNILDISTNSTRIKTLLCDSTYNFDLISFNHLGNGIKSSIIITTLSENTRIIEDTEPLTMATITGLTNGVSYTFTVIATNIKGDSTSSLPSLPIIPTTVPGTPTDISGIFESSHVSLSWTAPIDTGGSDIAYYNIFKSIDGIIYTVDSSSNTTTTNIIGLSSNTIYYFKISTVNLQGEGLQSIPISQTTLPSNVGTVIATKGNGLVDLSWNSVSGNGTISGYFVERSINNVSWFTDISSSVNTFYRSSGLTNGILYYYRVSAINTSGVGGPSVSVSTTPSTIPSVPDNLIVSSVASTSMTISWSVPATNGSPITSYNIYYSTDSFNFVLNSSSNTTSKTITGLSINTTYYFKVSAINTNGESPQSVILSQSTSNVVSNVPSNLLSSNITTTSLSLSWSAPENNGGSVVSSYNIYISTNGNSYNINSSANTTTTNITGLLSNTNYYFKISAINTQGESSQSSSISLSTLPSNVGTVIAIKGNALIDLSWNSVSGNGTISGYLVERSIDNISWITDISSSVNTFYRSSGLTNGILYYYKVSAINNTGKGGSSTAVSTIPSTVPSIPSTPTVSSVTSTSMNLSWSAPSSNGSSITSYNIYRSTDSSIFVLDSSSNTTSKTITNLSVNTTYYFKVSAINANGESSQSGILTQSTLNIVPNIPINLLSSSITTSNLTLSWTVPVSNGGSVVTSYNIYKSLDNIVYTIDSSSNTINKNITGLLSNTNYYFKISAINTQGESSQSSSKSLSTLPSNVGTVIAIKGNALIDLSWNSVSGNGTISGYLVERSIDNISWITDISSSVNTFYRSSGLTNGILYYYRVSAINNTGKGGSSTVVSSIPSTVPSTPSTPTVSYVAATSMTILWNASTANGSPITSYNIYYSTDSFNFVLNSSSNTTSKTITGLSINTTYYFKVSAINTNGESSQSGTLIQITSNVVSNIPSNLLSSNITTTSLSLSWSAPENNGGSVVSSYNIYISTDGIIYTVDSSANTTTTNIIGLLSNTNYYFKISAINLQGEGGQSTPISKATLPNNVGTVIATKGNGLVDLSWNSVSGNGTISGYFVERSINNVSWFTDISSSVNTFYRSSGLTNGILYYYRVSAINTSGVGGPSVSVSTTPSTIPSVPNTLIVSSVASTSMNLSWSAPSSNGSSITSYNIYRSTDSSIFVLDSSSNTTSKTITNLSVNTTYYFKVSAINANGESSQSDSITQSTLNIVPNIPTNLISSNITDSSLTLSWTIPLNNGGTPIIYYNIYKSIDNNIFIIDSSSNTTLKAITGLTGFTTYYFKVSAINSQGESLFSSTLIQETLGSIPGNITNLSGISISYSQIDISWNAPVSSGNYDLSGYNMHVFTVVGTGVGGGPPNVLIPYVDISNINTTFYNLIDLSSNTKYNINIEAFNINGVGSSTNIDITTLIPLSNPTDLSMNNGILSWNGTSPSYTITLYNTTVGRNIESNSINIHSEIVSSKSLDPNFIILETGYTNKYYDTKPLLLNLGLTKIRIISENAGNLSVDISGEFQFTVAVPDNPTNIQIIGNILSWTEPPNPISSNITGYKIFVYQNSTNSFVEALTINKTNSIILSNSWVPPNTTSFKVISLNTYGTSPQTGGGGEIVIPTPWGVPDPPTNLSAIQNGTGSTSQVYVNFVPPSFTGSTPIIGYTLQASASGETTKTITTHDSSGNILVPFLTIGKEWTFKIKATNNNGSSIWSTITTLTPTGSGTTTGDPIITTIYGERYLLPNVNARFLIFNNQKQNYPLYITADCFFLTSKELMESVFISKWSTDYTFMKTLLVKFKNYEITIDMNTLNISYKFIKNIHINIGEIYTDKMILSHHYSANRKRELENNLKFNGKSRKIDLIHEDKIYTLRVSVDLGCADHRNEFVLDGPDMKSGYGAIISKHHQTKLLDLKL